MLERGLNVELVRRTTRRSHPTEAGLAFYRRVKPALTEIVEARLEAAGRQAEPAGRLRIGAPVTFAPIYVVPAACDFMKRYPRVEVELKVSDQEVDLVAERLDMVVRIREMRDSALKARRLATLRVVVFGTPGYLAEHGRPQHPDDLARHECVVRLADGNVETWPFTVDGKRRSIRVTGRFRADGTASVNAAAASGIGLGLAPLWQIRDLVDRGDVEIVLEDFEVAGIPIHAVWPTTRTPLAKAQLFADFLAARLKRERM
jgi:DNA-binding transcriptional LysR family regulator